MTVFSVDWEEETLRQGHHLVKADGTKRGSRRLLEVRAIEGLSRWEPSVPSEMHPLPRASQGSTGDNKH